MFKKTIKITGSYQENLYTDAEGCGFWEPEMAQVTSITDHERALKSGGWIKRDLLEQVDTTGREVIIYRIAVPEPGTYSVDLRIDVTNHDIENMTVFTSRRNMLDNKVNIKAGKSYQRSFGVNVTPYIPALSSKPVEDLAIYVSFTGSGVSKEAFDGACISFEIIGSRKDLPVIWVGGDSTVTDQHTGFPYYPYGSCCGWAQTLTRFITGAAVCNLAHSGLTTNCFRDDDHYAIMLKRILPGDVVILQFGHNDQKRRNLKPFEGYTDNLKRYVREIKEMGAEVILCSPISRIPLRDENGHNYSLLKDYRDAVWELSHDLDVTFVDLHDLTFDKWIVLGPYARDYFIPGDVTHTNEFGGVLIANFFMEELRKRGSSNPLADYDNGLKPEFWPGDSDIRLLPKEEPEPDIFSIDMPYVDIKDYPAMDELKEAFHACLMDPCVMYLHPYAVMPRAQLLMTLFKALRITGKRPYSGRFEDISFSEWDAGYMDVLWDENLIDPDTIHSEGDKLFFRPDAPLTYDELDSILVRFLEKDPGKRDIPMKKCRKMAKELGIDKRVPKPEDPIIERYPVAESSYITRAEVYIYLKRFIDIAKDIKERNITFEA
ncbi:hypothetical protein D6855_05935 [Butyrivibrio sp. CB08]|uniref:GDSL-type esterase/lipase family protein n=1 Tax=Butyrivibrio sp. CB08 TaxID=2364879 RepID=UPI000EA893E6|nr:GDSL-type esterase/lipase family protein [Butyrivibrio sp. CB08]RKM61432.1 hypothetical protein D6855_05935 [Butyrivibrio sp. CB08]